MFLDKCNTQDVNQTERDSRKKTTHVMLPRDVTPVYIGGEKNECRDNPILM